VEAGRKVAAAAEPAMKEIIDIDDPKVSAGGKPAIVYYYLNRTPPDRFFMADMESIAAEYRGRVLFFRINVTAAESAGKRPKEVSAVPMLALIRGKERSWKKGAPGDNAKGELRFLIEDWLSQ
jgi:thioredoxin-like negative regulator of GroEL